MSRNRFGFVIMALCVVLATPVLAQSAGEDLGGSRTGAVLKNRAPVNKEVLQVNFPRPYETTFANGLHVMVLEDHSLPKVLFQILLPYGSLDDPQDMPGLASFTADLLSEGTGGLSSFEIANRLDEMGASFSAQSSFGDDSTSLVITGLAEHTEGILSLFSDLVLRPTFPADELDKYRTRELAALQQLRTRPSFLAEERFMAALYPEHPAHVVAPSEASLKSATVEDLAKFHDTYYVPKGAILAVTGDVTKDDIISRMKSAFGGWNVTPPAPLKQAATSQAQARKISMVDRPNSVQTSLKLGNVGIKRTDPDYAYVHVLNQILGANASSRLFLKLREEKGYTYRAYSAFRSATYQAPWYALADVRTDVTEGALTDFLAELQSLIDTPVPADELENAKRAIVARFALSLERSETMTARAIELKFYGLPADYWDNYPSEVNKVTAEDIQRVAKKYLDPARAQIVAVGDGEKILEVLEKFGAVEQYNADGTRTN